MIIKILLSYILGYLEISIEGYYIERFINLCRSNKIIIWHLKRKEEIRLNFRISVQDFRKVCKLAKKTKCKIEIQSKKGFPFLLHRYKKRKIFFALLLIFLFLMFLSSNFVWNVDIIEENEQNLENISQDIENAGLKNWRTKNKNRYKRNN